MSWTKTFFFFSLVILVACTPRPESSKPPLQEASKNENRPSKDAQNSSQAIAPSTETTAQAKKEEAPRPAAPQCFSQTFRHQALKSHQDGEACLHHQNEIQVAHARFNTQSLCVRVNGTPVYHKRVGKNSGRVRLAAVAGPDSVISVSYCLTKTKCTSDCKIPKDPFMESLGGAAEVELSKKNLTAEEIQLEKEMKGFTSELDSNSQKNIFKNWVSTQPVSHCKSHSTKRLARQ